jgi:sarcosine oxidase/L-pipecolate oxidase
MHELVWFEDYLHNRNQIVGYQGVHSEAEYLTSGVPQGSILGHLLFVLYVNDLPSVARNCKILMYADDTVLFYPEYVQ